MLGADFAILYGQYLAERSAYTDEAGTQSQSLHDRFFKAFRQTVF